MISRWISRGRVVRLEVVAVLIMLASENLMSTKRSGNQERDDLKNR